MKRARCLSQSNNGSLFLEALGSINTDKLENTKHEPASLIANGKVHWDRRAALLLPSSVPWNTATGSIKVYDRLGIQLRVPGVNPILCVRAMEAPDKMYHPISSSMGLVQSKADYENSSVSG
ncbi:hypothetical protein H4219_003380 [Mycoemilia scoparia]|uniref:Uncharacterized protein n=1 Tax=Mycoemilia scoparia TaxID=417184 RepID=A0A9W7ZV20_9FUNG|nr:hypothetical protein H4219_003380 [Mycoemilia scoparia]